MPVVHIWNEEVFRNKCEDIQAAKYASGAFSTSCILENLTGAYLGKLIGLLN